MSGELEAAGGMATAGLVAAAIEGSEPGEGGEGDCLNCGASLNGGRFCANCGQPAQPNRSLWHLIEELLWNVFNLDTKAWRTLPRLAFRPGTLTREYIDGKRARYLTPLATFLLCYFLMFLTFSMFQRPGAINLTDGSSAERVSDAREELKQANENLQEAQAGLAEAHREGGAHPDAGDQVAIGLAQRMLAGAQAHVARRQAALERALRHQQEVKDAALQVHVDSHDAAAIRAVGAETSPRAAPSSPAPAPAPTAPANSRPPAPPTTPVASGDDDAQITLDDVLKKIGHDNIVVDGKPLLSPQMQANLSNPPLFYNNLQGAASRWGFLLVPLSLPFIAFLFLFKKNITLFDHAVFALYALSFASLVFALIPAATSVAWLNWVPAVAIGIVLPVHMFFHVGGAYKLGWWSALWRTWFLLWFAALVLLAWLVVVLFIGLAG
jgi:F0F1-type ATP synthase membrane subunit b/b'